MQHVGDAKNGKRMLLCAMSTENIRQPMEWLEVKMIEFLWVPAIYLRHIEDVLTGKRDLNNQL